MQVHNQTYLEPTITNWKNEKVRVNGRGEYSEIVLVLYLMYHGITGYSYLSIVADAFILEGYKT
jgi:hypothetical protein